jgi:hypothetical protein
MSKLNRMSAGRGGKPYVGAFHVKEEPRWKANPDDYMAYADAPDTKAGSGENPAWVGRHRFPHQQDPDFNTFKEEIEVDEDIGAFSGGSLPPIPPVPPLPPGIFNNLAQNIGPINPNPNLNRPPGARIIGKDKPARAGPY